MAHLTAEQWQQIRRIWERDEREGFAWLVKEVELPVTRQRLSAKAAAEGWKKVKKTSADKDLGQKRGKKANRAESRPETPIAAKAKSSSRRTGKGDLRAAKDEGSGAQSPDPESCEETDAGSLKKTEKPKRASRKRRAASPSAGQQDGNERNSDRPGQWHKRSEIDIWRERFGGRPAEYQRHYAEWAHKQCLLYGATDEQLATFFDVSVRSIHYWKANYPEFLHAVKTGKSIADGNVVYGLYQRAVGMTIPDVHVSNYQGHVIITDIHKVIPPDVRAAEFWLRNRQRDHWQADPEPTPPEVGSLYPTEAEMEAQLAVSRAKTEALAKQARERRDRLGICTPDSTIPADATLMPKRRTQARADRLREDDEAEDIEPKGGGDE